MISMDDRGERRRSPLLNEPYKRRTLLSPEEGAGNSPLFFGQPPEFPAKRRRGLLSTPVSMMQTKPPSGSRQDSNRNTDFKPTQRRALLPQSSFQQRGPNSSSQSDNRFNRQSSATRKIPSLIAMTSASVGSTKPAPISTIAPTTNRRVLLPFTSDDQVKTTSSTTTASTLTSSDKALPTKQSKRESTSSAGADDDHKEAKKSRAAVLDLLSNDNGGGTANLGTDTKGQRSKSTMTDGRLPITKSSEADIGKETDLTWLHEQRSLIDKRISELQENAQEAGNDKDLVIYINGYYCRACRKVFRGDYAAKLAHCQENAHIYNADESANDSETIFKYFEERYEGIAFEDDVEDTDVSPSQQKVIASQQAGSMISPSSSSYVGEKSVDSDDDDEDGERRERFDRTRITRK